MINPQQVEDVDISEHSEDEHSEDKDQEDEVQPSYSMYSRKHVATIHPQQLTYPMHHPNYKHPIQVMHSE